MKNNRGYRIKRIIAVIVILCMLPVSELSGLAGVRVSAEGEGAVFTEPPAGPKGTEPLSGDGSPEAGRTENSGQYKSSAVSGAAIQSDLLTLSCRSREEGAVILDWNAYTGGMEDGSTVEYRIYRDEVLLGQTGANSYTDTAALRGERYLYQVIAVQGPDGDQLAVSNRLEIVMVQDWLVTESISLDCDMEVWNLTVDKFAHMDLNGHKLTVMGNISLKDGGFAMNGGYIDCRGDFTGETFSSLYMANENDLLVIEGDFEGYWGNFRCSAGTIGFKGGVTVLDDYQYKLSGSNRVILGGAALQRVNPGGLIFNTLEIQNYSEEGICSSKLLKAKELKDNGCCISYTEDRNYILGHRLEEDCTIEGDAVIYGGVMDLNGHTLTVAGNLMQYGGTVLIDGGRLAVEGDYIIADIEGEGESVYYNPSFGKLVMDQETDYVVTDGDFVMYSEYSGEGLFTEGVLEVHGDFEQYTTYYNWVEVNNYAPSGNHILFMKGSAGQSVICNCHIEAYLNHLEIENTSEEGVSISGSGQGLKIKGYLKHNGAKVSGMAEVADSSSVIGNVYNGSLMISGEIRNLNILGDLEVSNQSIIAGDVSVGGDLINWSYYRDEEDVFTIGPGRLEVQGDFVNRGPFQMKDEAAYLELKGSYIQNSSHDIDLEHGTIEVKGDFKLGEGSFRTYGPHRVILGGTKQQTIINTEACLQFANLELQNHSEKGVNVIGTMEAGNLITNQCRLTYGGMDRLLDQILEEDMVIDRDVAFVGGTLDLNGRTLTVHGDLLQMGGTININGGRLIVEGDYRIQTVMPDNPDEYGSSDGILVMQRPEDYVYIGGRFNAYTKSDLSGVLVNGVMELHGDVTLLGDTWRPAFRTCGQHKIILKGEGEQRICVPYDTDAGNAIVNLEIANQSEAGVTIEGGYLEVTGSLSGNGCRVNGMVCVQPNTSIAEAYRGDIAWVGSGTITDHREIHGSLQVGSGIELKGSLTVDGDLNIVYNNENEYGRIWTDQGSLTVKGNVNFDFPDSVPNIYSNPIISMKNEEDYIDIWGNFNIKDKIYVDAAAGTLEVKGDIDVKQYQVFKPKINKLLLSGNKKQTIRMPGAQINILELTNHSADGIWFHESLSITRLILNGCHISYSDMNSKSGWTLEQDQVINGDLYLTSGTLDLNGHELTVTGKLIQADGTIWFHGGRLNAEQGYYSRLKRGNEYDNGYGILRMEDEEDYFYIDGNYEDSSLNESILTAGTIEIQGNFIRTTADGQYTSSGTHRVIFSGGEDHTISGSRSMIVLANLIVQGDSRRVNVTNTVLEVTESLKVNGKWVDGIINIHGSTAVLDPVYDGSLRIAGNGTMTGDLKVTGNIYLEKELVVEGNLCVGGQLAVRGGYLHMNGGSLIMGRLVIEDLENEEYPYAFHMSRASDHVHLNGGYTDQSQRKVLWDKGTLEVGGNIKIDNRTVFRQGRDHKLILCGSRQSMDITSPYYSFGYVELKNDTIVDIMKPVKIETLITNGGTVTYGGRQGNTGWKLEADQVIDKDLDLTGGILDLNGYTLTINGDLRQAAGVIRINGGRLVIKKDYRLVNEYNMGTSWYTCSESLGTLEMKDSADCVIVEGDMVIRTYAIAVNQWSAGQLELKGNLTQTGDGEVIQASGSHTVILSGDKEQFIRLDSPDNTFNHFVNKNSSKQKVWLDNVRINGQASDVSGNIGQSGYAGREYSVYLSGLDCLADGRWSGSVYLNENSLCTRDAVINGKLVVDAELRLNGCDVTAGGYDIRKGALLLEHGIVRSRGDFNVTGSGRLVMNDADGYMFVEGNFLHTTAVKPELTAGTMELYGDFTDRSRMGFRASGRHKVILGRKQAASGNPYRQTVLFDTEAAAGFHTLVLTRPADEGYRFMNPVEDICDQLVYDIFVPAPPAKVTGLSVSDAAAAQITLQWEKDQGETRRIMYEIFRDGERIAVTDQCVYTDRGLDPETSYTYYVCACDEKQNRSEASEPLIAGTCADTCPPEVPSNLSVYTRTGSSITLSWDEAKDDVGTAGYEIYRNGELIGDVSGSRWYKDSTAVKDNCNTYQIAAIDQAGNRSEKSREVTAFVAMPSIIRTIPEDGGRFSKDQVCLTVVFRNAGNSTGNTVRIEWENEEEEWELLTEEPVSQRESSGRELTACYDWDIRGIISTRNCRIRYTLCDADGNEDQCIVNYRVDRTPPVTPGSLTVVADNGTAKLRWDPSISADCQYYTVYRRANGADRYDKISRVEGRFHTFYTDNGITAGTVYDYKVTASDDFDQESEGICREGILAVRDESVPVITGMLPRAGRVSGVVSLSAEAQDNIGVDRIAFSFCPEGAKDWEEIGGGRAENGRYALDWDTSALNGTYQVRAVAADESGNLSEAFLRRYEVDNTGPARIRMKEAKTGDTWVQLFWEDAAEPDFGWFEIEQKTGSRWEKTGTQREVLGYTVTGLKPETAYTFRVTGVDDLGSRGEPSEEITAVTGPDTAPPVITWVGPQSSYYKGTVALSMTVTDNAGGGKARFAWSYDKKEWNTIEEAEAGDTETAVTYRCLWDTDALREGTAYVRFEAWDGAGHPSAVKDGPVCVEYRIDRTAPAAVQMVKAEGKEGYIHLTWDPGTETDLKGWRIYRASGPDGVFRVLETDISRGDYYDTTAVPGGVYRYQVAAVDLAGNVGPRSKAVLAQAVPDTEAPKVLGMSPSDGQTAGADPVVRIWAADNGGLGRVEAWYRPSEEETALWQPVFRKEATGTSALCEQVWHTEGLTEGVYELKACAADAVGNTGEPVYGTFCLDLTAPAAPAVTLQSGGWQIGLTWEGCTEEDFSHYELYRQSACEEKARSLGRLKEGRYVDEDVVPGTVYTYQVKCLDRQGNAAWSEPVSGTATDEDTTAPTARLPQEILGIAGMEFVLDGTASHDNVKIVRYTWDLGNGDRVRGVQPVYAYEKAGTYTVTLTVEDAAGNQASTSAEVTILSADRSGSVKVQVTNEAGKPLPYAYVYVKTEEGERRNLRTDGDGQVLVAALSGSYPVAAYKEGYLPKEDIMEVHNYENGTKTIVLEAGDIVVGSLDVRRMELEEMVQAGIDVSDPANYHSYIFHVEMQFSKEPIPTYQEYIYIGGTETVVPWGNQDVEHPAPGTGAGTGGFQIAPSKAGGGGAGAGEELPVLVYLRTPDYEISWLKDMYVVELGIVNQADPSYVIEGAQAEIELPEGLSLAGTLEGQEAVQRMGAIPGQERGRAVWYLRGDKPGSYTVKASFDGTLQPFEAAIHTEFVTEKQVEVSAGTGLHLYIMPEDKAYLGQAYYVQFMLRNESNQTYYNLKTTFGAYTDPGYAVDIKVTDKETGEVWREGDGEPAAFRADRPSQCEALPVMRGGDRLEIGVMAPGEAVFGTFSAFLAAEGDPDEVYYQLRKTIVNQVSEANTGLQVMVEEVPSHILRYNVDLYTIDNRLWADPVDTATGAFLEQYEALSVTGETTVALDLKYNSRLTGEAGRMGRGWSHSYETFLREENGQVKLYWTPENYAVFLREEAVRREVNGVRVNRQIVLDTAEEAGAASYTCISGGMEAYRLERDDNGRYTVTAPEGERYAFDRAGRLTGIGDADGKSVSLVYEENRMTVTDDGSGRFLRLQFGTDGRAAWVEDAEGRKTTFAYEGEFLSRITNPLGETTAYTYDEGGHILTATDGDGIRYAANTYDGDGRVLSQEDGEAATPPTVFSYEDKPYGGVVTTVTDRNGNTLTAETDRSGHLVRTVDQNGAVQSAVYDGNGNLRMERDTEGNAVYYDYDREGRVIRVRDAYGSTTGYGYDAAGNLTVLSGEGGRTAYYAYDAENRLVSATGFAGEKTTYTYDRQGRLTAQTAEGKGTKRYAYERGQLAEETDGRGNTARSAYDARGNLICSTDRTGAETRYEYDRLNRLVRITDPAGCVTEYAYDGRGNVARKTVDGAVTKYTYDGNRLLAGEERPDGSCLSYGYDGEGRLTCVTGPDGKSARTEYDGAGHAVRTTTAAGETWCYTYDGNGRRTSETGPDGRTVRYTYYPNGKLHTTVYPDGRKELCTYDKNWQLLLVSDGSRSVSYEYDAAGHVTAERDGEGNTVTYGYDKAGSRTSVTDANGNTTRYGYDENGNCTEVVDAAGLKTEYEYDGENRLVRVRARVQGTVRERVFRYDGAGRLVETVDEEGNRRQTGYDAQGRVTAETDALGQTTASYTYDGLGRLETAAGADGRSERYGYDAGDRLVCVTEENGTEILGQKHLAYEENGRLCQVTDALGGESRCEYSPSGQLVVLVNPGGGQTGYAYDAMGRLDRETVEGNGAIRYTYGPSGQMASRTNGRGQETRYTYDRAGRLTELTDALGTVRYTYDGNGNVRTVTDGTGTATRDYDCLNRVVRYTDSRGNTIRYSYDELGNLLALTYPGGEIVRYTYDKAGRLTAVTDWKGRSTRYAYDGNGRLCRTERPDGTTETRCYDAAGQLREQTDRKGEKVLREVHYTYDSAGHVAGITGQDSVGAGGLAGAEMTYDRSSRLVTWNGKEVRYDADGNMVYGPVDGVMCELEYDCRNRLVRAGETRYEYDGENRRTAVVKDGIRTELVTNTEAVLSQVLLAVERKEESGGSAEVVKEIFYVYGNGLVSEESKDRGYLLYHYDHLGSTSLLTDGNGTVKRKYAYGPYGELVSGDRQGIRFLYNGQYGVETDGNGLYYMRARYYNESVKRFINQDVLAGSAADSPSLNRYAYVQGNPVSLTDPFGLSPSLAFRTIGHSLLGLVGFIVPGVGELADVVNAAWYFAEGDTLNGWLSLGSALPGIGSAAGQGIKLAFGNGSRAASMAKLVKDGSRLVGHAVTFGQTAYHGSGTAVEMYDKYYVQGLKPGADTVLEAGSLVLDVVTCVNTGKSLVSDVQSAVQSVRVAGREMSGFFREKFGRPGAVGSKTGQPVLRMNLQFFASSNNNTYYHVTTREAAEEIIKLEQLGSRNNAWEARVFAWNEQPTLKQAKLSGVGARSQVVLKFDTKASFELDRTVNSKLIGLAVQTTDAQRLPIRITNISDVGFKKAWWKIWN